MNNGINVIVPPKLVSLCNSELAKYIDITFQRYDGAGETMYYEDYIIKKSDNSVWEAAREMMPTANRLTIENVLARLAKNGGIVVIPLPEQEKSNDELIRDNCSYALGRYIHTKFQEYLKVK